VQTVSPNLRRMPQLDGPLVSLTVVGVLAAIVAFLLIGVLTKRPFFWYRIVAVGALLLSWIPDIMLGMGGQRALLATRVVSPVAFLFGGPGGPGGGGPPPGGPPPGAGAPGGAPGGGGFTT